MHMKASNPSKKPRAKPTSDVWESMHLDSRLRPWAVEKRKEMGQLMDSSYTELTSHVEATTFPFFLLPKIAALGTAGTTIKDFGGPGMTIFETAAILFEIAKRDVSVATFYNVHT